MIPRKILSIKNSFQTLSLDKKHIKIGLLLIFISAALLWYIFSIPRPLFTDSYCTVITDRNGELLGAKISDDGQFRFPERETVPYKLKKCIIEFEDKRFYKHSGFDPVAVGRAFWQNIHSGEIVSGASTLSMQVIRLARKNKGRTIFEKFTEIFRASRLELSFTKDEILSLYFSHAPFGGNVVGLDAASWRWFGMPPEKLTWAQSATLSVLPNAPALIHPGRNSDQLIAKRNRLLKRLFEQNAIDSSEYQLAVSEPVPESPKPFPFLAYHLLTKASAEKSEQAIIQTTIDADIQKLVNQIVFQSHKHLEQHGIMNLGAIVLDTETGEVLAYVGNVPLYNETKTKNYELHVDMMPALRSTGSVLKPFLYASMLSSGDILENAFVPDIPTKMGGFMPQNFNRTYDGMVPASRALERSLNIPASRMLRQYGLERFYYQLEKTGLSSLNRHPGYYGLSLVLGGCEASLWELAGIYASTGRSLLHFQKYGNRYNPDDYHSPWLYMSDSAKYLSTPDSSRFSKHSVYDASALWTTFKVMLNVDRPETELNAEDYYSSQKISWKTGTSFGFRDAWAIGLTPRYTVGVWAGNADGEGRAGLIGVKAAAPVLFRIFGILPKSDLWFPFPDEDVIEIKVCKQSGFLAGPNCPEPVSIFGGKQSERFAVCPYHKLVHLDPSGQYRVHGGCMSVHEIVTEKRLVLPPAAEKYYKKKHPSYRGMPPYRADCQTGEFAESDNIEIIYPHNYSQIYIPTEIDGTPGKAVFEAVHRKADSRLFWYLDKNFIASTQYYHLIELRPAKGKHELLITDEKGEKITRIFEILSENER